MADGSLTFRISAILIFATGPECARGISPIEFRRRLIQSMYGQPESTLTLSTRSGLNSNHSEVEVDWDSSGKFEGDILLSPRQIDILSDDFANDGSGFRNVIDDLTKRWPDNTVVYAISPKDFTKSQIQAIFLAMDEIECFSCIRFKPRQREKYYVVITGVKDLGCISEVGYQHAAGQLLNLAPHGVGSGCFSHGTIVHELLHSLGMMHMQNTADRDKYVYIDWRYIKPGNEQNFVRNPVVLTYGLPYDYSSVMHYPDNAFSIHKPNLKTVIPRRRAKIGQRVGMSLLDKVKLNRMYNCTRSKRINLPAKKSRTKRPPHT